MALVSDIIQIEIECNISVSDDIIVRDVLPKAIEFRDGELKVWILDNDLIKRFKIAGLQININSPPRLSDLISYLSDPLSKYGGLS
jgi:hypothetical protein